MSSLKIIESIHHFQIRHNKMIYDNLQIMVRSISDLWGLSQCLEITYSKDSFLDMLCTFFNFSAKNEYLNLFMRRDIFCCAFFVIWLHLQDSDNSPSLIWFTYEWCYLKKVFVTIVPLFNAVAFLLCRVNSFMTFC